MDFSQLAEVYQYFNSKLNGHPNSKDLEYFEKIWRCQLPEDYRNYILKHGFAASNLNLTSPRFWFDGFPYDVPGQRLSDWRQMEYISPDWLVEPCPITPEISSLDQTGPLYTEINQKLANKEIPVHDWWSAAYKISANWKQDLPSFKIDPYQGTICIAYHGCTYYDLLVVTGPARGRTISYCCDDGPPSFYEAKNFLDYLEYKRTKG